MFFKKGFEKLKEGLKKTRQAFSRFGQLFAFGRKIDAAYLDELEAAMIGSDMGTETTTKVIEELKLAYKEKRIADSGQVLEYLKTSLKQALKQGEVSVREAATGPTVILVVGVNGVGKTTSIAKLAWLYKDAGKKVILGAGDTFRAAAIEQLTIWCQRLGVEIVKHQQNADPAAVAYDAVEAAMARNADVLLIDTAGRLHTKQNLMQELAKIRRVIQKKLPEAPHETILVLDATTGQNALSQTRHFTESAQITGLFLAKLDGTAKGGIVIPIKNQFNIPVKFIGTGEKYEDVAVFDPDTFVDALFATDAAQ